MADSIQTIDREVFGRRVKAEDLEVHTSLVALEEDHYVEIREYVPSLNEYGRGIVMQIELANGVRLDLNELFIAAMERKIL